MNFFDYYIPATLAGQIRPGVFVKIPFKKQTLIGIVHSLKDKTEFAGAKEIIGVAEEYGELSETQFALMLWFARYYYYSFGSTADLIFPAPLKRRVNIREQAPKTPFSNFIKPDKSATALAARVFNEKNKKYLLFPYNQAKKDGFFVSLCETAVKKQETLLILFPQVAKVEAFFHCLPQSVRAATIIFTADAQAAKAKHWRDWQAVRSGEKRVILGTRSAVFAPLPARSLVVVDDAHSDDYKQWDQNPRYEVINVARQLCDLNNGKIILSSVCPRVEDAAMAQKEKYLSITMPAFGSTDITIVDIRQNKDFSFLEVRPKTGRTHQIRVHLKSISHPVVCDKLYGSKKSNEVRDTNYDKKENLGFDRLALHSLSIKLELPNNAHITIESPLPKEFENALNLFKNV